MSEVEPHSDQNEKGNPGPFVERFLKPLTCARHNLVSFKAISTRMPEPTSSSLKYWPRVMNADRLLAFVLVLGTVFFVIDPLVVPAFRSLPKEAFHLFAWITELATAKVYLIPAGIIALLLLFCHWQSMSRRLRFTLLQLSVWVATIILAIGAGGLMVNLAKRMIGRARPKHFDELGAFGFEPFSFSSSFASFPSGHATTTGSALMLALIFFPKWRVSLIVAAAIFALSRVVLGAHYMSDVVLGVGLGAMFTWMIGVYFAKRGLGFVRDDQVLTGLAPKSLVLSFRQITNGIVGACSTTFKL